jgi:hypothetical protein
MSNLEGKGDVAQLVERPLCTRKVSGSIPLISTSLESYKEFEKLISCVKKEYIQISCVL